MSLSTQVLVGIGTVRRDDPLLTCRLPGGRNPRRVVLDGDASLSPESRLVRAASDAPVIVACQNSAPAEARKRLLEAGCLIWPVGGERGRADPDALLRRLGHEQVTNLMVEGGSEVFTSFFERGLIDEVRIFVAPKIIGGASAPTPLGGDGIQGMPDAVKLRRVRWEAVGEDMLLTGLVRHEAHEGHGENEH